MSVTKYMHIFKTTSCDNKYNFKCWESFRMVQHNLYLKQNVFDVFRYVLRVLCSCSISCSNFLWCNWSNYIASIHNFTFELCLKDIAFQWLYLHSIVGVWNFTQSFFAVSDQGGYCVVYVNKYMQMFMTPKCGDDEV